MKRLVIRLAFLAAALAAACDATTSGLQVQSPSPYPYNPRW
jgi:hypothetical protein